MATGGNINYIINVNGSGAVNGINQVNSAFNNLRATGQQMFQMGTLLSTGITAPLLMAAKQGLEFDSMMQQAKVNYGTLLGDMDKGSEMVNKIKAFADVTPFQMPELMQAGKLMLAYGVNAEKIMPSIERLGDIAMGDKDRFGRLSLAFSQVTATGRLMGQDLLQLVSAGFNPLQVISEKTGISMIDLRKKMEAGGISAELVAATMKMATQEGGRFHDQMEKASKTFEGRLSTLKDAANTTLGAVMLPLFNVLADVILPKLTNEIKYVANWFNTLSEKAKVTILVVTGLIGVVLPLIFVIGGLATVVIGCITPFTLWVAAMAVVATAIGYLLVTNEDFRVKMAKIWNGIADYLNEVFVGILNEIIKLVEAWEAMDKDTKAVFYNVGKGIAALAGSIVGSLDFITSALGPATRLIYHSFQEIGQVAAAAYQILSQKKGAPPIDMTATFEMISETRDKVDKDLEGIKEAFIGGEDTATKYANKFVDSWDKISKIDTTKTLEELKKIQIPKISDEAAKKGLAGIFGDMKIPDMASSLKGAKEAAVTSADLMDLLKKGTGKASVGVDALNTKVKSLVESIKQQTKSFAEFTGLFDKVQLSGTSSGESLIRRLDKQVKTMLKWKDALAELRSKMGSNGAAYMQAIQELGPSATNGVVGLSKLSPERLAYATEQYNKKMGIAGNEAANYQIGKTAQDQKVNQLVVNITGNNIKNDADMDAILVKLIAKLNANGIR